MKSYILEAIWGGSVRQELGEFKSMTELNTYLETCEYNGKETEYEVFEKSLIMPKFKKEKLGMGTEL